MDERRYEELKAKRFDQGLTDEEADELGRMMAEEEGKPYGNADGRPHPDAEPEAWKAVEERVKAEEERGDEPAPETEEPTGDHESEEERAVGTERQPVGPAGSGYVPPKGAPETPDR